MGSNVFVEMNYRDKILKRNLKKIVNAFGVQEALEVGLNFAGATG